MNPDPLIRVTAMPGDTNRYGGVFGGWMSQMALGAGALASRVGRGKAVARRTPVLPAKPQTQSSPRT